MQISKVPQGKIEHKLIIEAIFAFNFWPYWRFQYRIHAKMRLGILFAGVNLCRASRVPISSLKCWSERCKLGIPSDTAGQNPGRLLHRFAHASHLPACAQILLNQRSRERAGIRPVITKGYEHDQTVHKGASNCINHRFASGHHINCTGSFRRKIRI